MHTTQENVLLAEAAERARREAEQRNQSNATAPSEWFGTPMEMVAEAFGMESPWRNRTNNWKAHKRNAAKRRARRNELAKASRKRNRRK